MEKIYKTKNSLIVEVPLKTKRYNPYMDDNTSVGEMDTVCALIGKDKFGNDRLGFCKYIDMAYKYKGDQWTDYFYMYWGEKKDFEELCKKLRIDIIYE